MKSLLNEVTDWMEHQKNKHDLGENYVEKYVNAWTNYELLQNISEALDCLLNEQPESKK